MGILASFIAKMQGASKVILTGMNSGEIFRFNAALKVGADRVVNVEKEDPLAVVRELTGGRGADVMIETSGAPPAIRQGVAALKRKGRISAIGLCAEEQISFPWNVAMHKVLDVRFNFSSSYTSWNTALGLLRDQGEKLSALITHRFRLEDWENTFKLLEEERGIKAVYLPE
jgi:L-iditol 2-dehydrogenase